MKYKIAKEGFISSEAQKVQKTILYTDKGYSTSWLEKQEASYSEYEDTHEAGNHPEHIKNVFFFYKTITASYCLKLLNDRDEVNILDVGCGISKEIPYYVPESKYINYIGLDPIERNPERDYKFICSRLENIGDILERDSIDIFLFSTSLDHFEEIEKIYDLLKTVGKKNAYIIICSGMHDTGVIATLNGMNFLKKFTNTGPFKKGLPGKIKYMNRLRIFNSFMLRNYQSYAKRSDALGKGIALDNLHFHYFQHAPYMQFLKTKMGELVDVKELELGNIIISVNKIV